MSDVVRRKVKGRLRWVIDMTLVAADGSKTRYRRVAKVQNPQSAELEAKGIRQHWAQHEALPATPGKAPKPTPKTATYEDAVAYYEKHELPLRSASTQEGYQSMFSGPWMKLWEGTKLVDITYRTIQRWDQRMHQSGMQDSTRRNHHVLLRVVIKSVGPFEDEPGIYLDELPKFPRLPKVGKKAVEATELDDIAKLLGSAKRGLRIAVLLAVYGGLRSGEIRQLRREDVNLKQRALTLKKTKNGHQRVIPLNNALQDALRTHLKEIKDPKAWVSTNSGGGQWSAQSLYQAYSRLVKRLGLSSTRVHALRHAFATQLFARGADAITVMNLLGHSDLATTQRYSHTNQERARGAVAALDGLL